MQTTSERAETSALWMRLKAMTLQPSRPGKTFVELLASRKHWPLDYARRVTEEYRRFLFLAATAGKEITPSQAVDEAWHLHLTSPHYRDELCAKVLGHPLDHQVGTGGAAEEERLAGQCRETLTLYRCAFGEAPPADIWPTPAPFAIESETPARTPLLWMREQLIFTALCAALAVGSFAGGKPGLGSAALIGGALLLTLVNIPWGTLHARDRRNKSEAGCGGGYGIDAGTDCAGSDGGSCCGSSCGGGGCGGGD